VKPQRLPLRRHLLRRHLPLLAVSGALLLAILPAALRATAYFDGSYIKDISSVIGADAFYNAGITGQGATVANIEGSNPDLTFPSLVHVPVGNLFVPSGATTATPNDGDHSTHVSQIIAGRASGDDDTATKAVRTGIASGATLYAASIATFWDPDPTKEGAFNTSYATLRGAYTRYFVTSPVDVINSSWGGGMEHDGRYESSKTTRMIDNLAARNPHTTMVVAAGNEYAPAGGVTSTVGSPANGFNVISVGALAVSGGSFDSIVDFSSRGPVDVFHPVSHASLGQRAAVHIVAPGSNITVDYISSSGTLYYGGGTSYAAPIVAGGVALMASASRDLENNGNGLWSAQKAADARDSRVIRAVLMNSAKKTADWSNNTQTGSITTATGTYSNVRVTTQALDYTLGAGALDLTETYRQYTGGGTGGTGTGGGGGNNWTLDTVSLSTAPEAAPFEQRYAFDTSVSAQDTITLTLSWFAGYSDSYSPTNDNTSSTGNDLQALANLDLQLWSLTGEGGAFDQILAVSMTTVDTVEHLTYTLADGVADQWLAVVVVHEGMVFDTRGAAADTTTTYALASSQAFEVWVNSAVPEPAAWATFAGLALLAWAALLRNGNRRNPASRG
jgi:hypothetical protein